MGFSLSDQTAYFLWSLVLGAALAVLYDVVRAVRMTVRAGRVHVMISDILFFTVCGVITSLFALPFNKGDVRAFILFGEAVGFLAYRLTLGAIMGKVYAFFARVIRGFVQKTRKLLEKIFNFLLKAIVSIVYNVGVVIDKSRKKAAENKKKKRAAKAKAKRQRRLYKERQNEQKKKHQKAGHRGKDSARKKRRGAGRR
ncbi:MAG: spore cortex biosynthesis protein YabQ [Ruminococcus sp.]|nr:spore cortex biosynthesis protein YabQ [Ruminococcus sp.]